MDGDINAAIDALALEQIRHRPAGARARKTRPCCAARAAIPTTSTSPGQAYAVMVRSRYAHGTIRRHRHRGGAQAAGRARRLYRGRSRRPPASSRSNAAWRSQNRDGTPWHTPARPVAGQRQGALCRRAGRLRRRRDRGAGQGRGRGGRCRHRSAAGRDHARPRPPRPARRSFTTARPATSLLDFHYGDTAKVAAAFAKAAHVTQAEARQQPHRRQCPMEPRSAIGEYDAATGRYTLTVWLPGRVRPARHTAPAARRRRPISCAC